MASNSTGVQFRVYSSHPAARSACVALVMVGTIEDFAKLYDSNNHISKDELVTVKNIRGLLRTCTSFIRWVSLLKFLYQISPNQQVILLKNPIVQCS